MSDTSTTYHRDLALITDGTGKSATFSVDDTEVKKLTHMDGRPHDTWSDDIHCIWSTGTPTLRFDFPDSPVSSTGVYKIDGGPQQAMEGSGAGQKSLTVTAAMESKEVCCVMTYTLSDGNSKTVKVTVRPKPQGSGVFGGDGSV